jgi:uncharacterized membrane protein YdjX (TVP38/TMEM64 family)
MGEKIQSDQARSNKRWFRFGVISVLGFVVFIGIFFWGIDPTVFHGWVEEMHGALVFLLMALLPLVGFPASIIFVVAGAKFGSGWGLLAVSASIALNLLATYWICTSFLRRFVKSVFQKTKYRMPQVPEGEYVSITLLTVLVPGLPYSAKNYLLVLGGVPFKPYFWAALPGHIFHASLALFFGDLSDDLTPGRIAFLVVYALLLAGLSRHVVRRLKAHRRPEAEAPSNASSSPAEP